MVNDWFCRDIPAIVSFAKYSYGAMAGEVRANCVSMSKFDWDLIFFRLDQVS